MTEVTRGSVLETVLSILSKMDEDGELEVEITPETWLVADMGLESIDVVVLGTTVQEHYHMSMPFAEFLAEVGQRETRDIQVREFVDFVVRHLNGMG
jgi:acyl carrier protein